MVVALWSAKGGAGVTVCSVGAAVGTAESGIETLLVDTRGDMPAVCGIPEPSHGIWDWTSATEPASPAALGRIEVDLGRRLSLLGSGHARAVTPGGQATIGPLRVLAQLLLADPRQVVVDLGELSDRPGPELELASALQDGGASMLLVTRACYLSVRRATRLGLRPDGVVVVREPGRALQDDDLSAVIGAPVVSTVDVDPAVSRSVDSGMLVQRRPRPFLKSIARAVA